MAASAGFETIDGVPDGAAEAGGVDVAGAAAGGAGTGGVAAGGAEVGGVERALRTDLADAVRQELTKAGLPVGDDPDDDGAEIEVDLGDDAAGGVFVTWRPGKVDVEAANRSLLDGGFDDTSQRRTDATATIMRDAMIAVLAGAGFDVRPSDDVMRPLALRVNERAAAAGGG